MVNTKTFIVTVDLPRGVTSSEMKAHIEEAIQVVGHLPPEEPLFDLDRESVKVKNFRRSTNG